MAVGGPRGRVSLRPMTMALLAVGAIGAVVVGLVWTAGAEGRASGRAGGGADTDAAAGSEARGQPLRWDGARLVRGDPDRLTLYFTGGPPGPPDDPCARSYQATAAVSGDRMSVTLRELSAASLPPGHGCADVGYGRTISIELPERLRDRLVLDGATGEQRPVIDAGLLLSPSWLPAGYRFVSERVELDRRGRAPSGSLAAPVSRPVDRPAVECAAADPTAGSLHELGGPARPWRRGRPGRTVIAA
jgi:hypothetical protein